MDKIKRKSKREFLKEKIKGMIHAEGLEKGDIILSQNQLAEKFSVNPITAGKALNELCEEDMLYRIQGRGTFVGPAPTKSRKIALILPAANLDRPENNPERWAHFQHLMHEFTGCLGKGDSFSTVIIPRDEPYDVGQLREYTVVFFLNHHEYHELIKKLIDDGITYPVVMGGVPVDFNCLGVCQDMVSGVKLGISHLLSLKHRKIALFHSDEEWGNCYVKGYCQAFADYELQVDKNNFFSGFDNFNDGIRAATILMNRNVDFDAVFAPDHVAVNIVHTLRAEGIKVPHDISVMGYHGLNWVVNHPPYLTTVKVPIQQMIQYALAQIDSPGNNNSFKKAVLFTGSIIHGQTCI